MRDVLGRFLVALCGSCYRNPRRALTLLGLSFVVAVVYGGQNLRLELAWTYLFEADDPVVVDFEEARAVFPYPGDIAVLVDQGTARQREAFLDLVAREMSKEPEVYHLVFYRFDLQKVGAHALYYLDNDVLHALAQALSGSQIQPPEPLVGEPAVKLQLKLLEDLKQALLSRGRSTVAPIWQVFADKKGGRASQTLLKLLGGKRYIYATLAENKVHALIFKGGPRGSELASGGQEVRRVRELLRRVQPAAYGLRVRLTGLPVMLYDERQTCAQDSLRSGLLSLALILGVFVVGFGGFRKPLFSLAGLVCGMGWTLAYSAVTVGHLNFITVTMVSMLMGLGIDFGIHFLFRYEEQCRSGVDRATAIEITAGTTGVDTLVGATATSASFLALTATSFRGVSDLGILASGGVMLCFFSTVMVLPALLSLFPGPTPAPRMMSSLAQFDTWLAGKSRSIAWASALVLSVGLLLASRVGFSYNLLELQAPGLASVQTEREMLRDYNTTVLSGAVLLESREAARAAAARLRTLSTVSGVGTVTDLLPEAPESKRALVDQVVAGAVKLDYPTPVALDGAQDLRVLQQRLEEMELAAADKAKDPSVMAAVDDVKGVVSAMPPGPIQDGLRSFQRAVLRDFGKLLGLLKTQKRSPLELSDLPPEFRERYVSPEGVYLVSVQPRENIWESENLKAFLAEVESLGLAMVGHPVVQAHILESFDRTFQVTPWYTLLGVVSVMLISLRKPAQVLLCSVPTAFGVVLIFAVMALTGMDFNVVNFVALPISVGIGAVYGVHALHRLEEMGDQRLLSTSTGYAIMLSGLTTIAGFASLMTASHRGLSSFGFVISVGVMANLVVSLIVLPAIRRCLDRPHS